MDVDAAMAAADARMKAIEKRQAEKITNLQAKLAALRKMFHTESGQVSQETVERTASRRPSRELMRNAIKRAADTGDPLTEDEWRAEESLDNGEPIAFPRNSLRAMACCDCGLVHLVNVTHVLEEYIILTMTRDDAATAIARKARHPALVADPGKAVTEDEIEEAAAQEIKKQLAAGAGEGG